MQGLTSAPAFDITRILEKIEEWKQRVINLSKDNQLLHFRPTKTSTIRISNPSYETIFEKLVQRRKWTFQPPPRSTNDENKQAQLQVWTDSTESEDGLDDRQIQTQPRARARLICEGYDREQFETILQNLHRKSLSEFREKGVIVLQLAIGQLTWKQRPYYFGKKRLDSGSSKEANPEPKKEQNQSVVSSLKKSNDKLEEVKNDEDAALHVSPLVLVPVELTRDSVNDPYTIEVPEIESDAVINPVLQAALKTQFDFEFPEPPDDWEERKLGDYLSELEEKIREADLGPEWAIEPNVVWLGLFSFSKLVIYRDLEKNANKIAQNSLVQSIADPINHPLPNIGGLPEVERIDEVELPKETFHILEADSSQRICIDHILRGQSLVMQGPPGTGKSQTIANLIAQCIGKGKTVLFVSEKIAALDVVYKRLKEKGLDEYCLVLHSNKTSKAEVIRSLKESYYGDPSKRKERELAMADYESLVSLRKKLNGYVSALHAMRDPTGMNAREALSKLAALQSVPLIAADFENIKLLDRAMLEALSNLVLRLSRVWQVMEENDFPWVGYTGSTSTKDRFELQERLKEMRLAIQSLQQEGSVVSGIAGLKVPNTMQEMTWLTKIAKQMEGEERAELNWILPENPKQNYTVAIIQNLNLLKGEADHNKTIFDTYLGIVESLKKKYGPDALNLPTEKLSNVRTIVSDLSREIGTNVEDSVLFFKKSSDWAEFCRRSIDELSLLRDQAKKIAEYYRLDLENLNLAKLGAIAKATIIGFGNIRPNPEWITSPERLEQVREAIASFKRDFEEFRALRADLAKRYTEILYELDIDGLLIRFNGSYRSRFHSLNPKYYSDQSALRRASRNGKLGDSLVEDLVKAKRVGELKLRIDQKSKDLSVLFGGSFYRGYDTNFELLELAYGAALSLVSCSEILGVPKEAVARIPPASQAREMEQVAIFLRDSLAKWTEGLRQFNDFLPHEGLTGDETILVERNLVELLGFYQRSSRKMKDLLELMQHIGCSTADVHSFQELFSDLEKVKQFHDFVDKLRLQKEDFLGKFGSRYSDLETDWSQIINLLQWSKKLIETFENRPIPESFCSFVSAKRAGQIQSKLLCEKMSSYESAMAQLSLLFESPLPYKGQMLNTLPLEDIEARISEMEVRIEDIQHWIEFKLVREELWGSGLRSFFLKLVEKMPPASKIPDIFQKAILEEWIDYIWESDENLKGFERDNHNETISRFRDLDQKIVEVSSKRVALLADLRKPKTVVQAADSEMGLLLKQFQLKRGLMPTRVLFPKISNVLPRLKPCLLMSPISVSQFLPPEQLFDIVVFDEASQVLPEDAIGAGYRGKVIVVAGDDKQLPPTSFFQNIRFQDEVNWDSQIQDGTYDVFESILNACLAAHMKEMRLQWHYRSKHEGLIAFSNNQFYGGELITFPSTSQESKKPPVTLEYVPGAVYDRGKKSNNVVEAKRVAEIVFEQIKKDPKKTIGVVAFSEPQEKTIDEEVIKLRKVNPQYESYFKEDRLDGFFIKNLETVQGDERDIIIFSIGYGPSPDKDRTISMNFGPLNKEGGQRRLNVAATRAKERVIVVSSIKASDIRIKETKSAGVLALHQYLDFAERGLTALDLDYESKGDYESPLERSIGNAIIEMGYGVIPQVGCSSYRIDLAVIDPAFPGRYILAVECDGATYHSAKSARDRDRLRQQVLENLGWKVHRVWSKSWIHSRESELKRLKTAIESARDIISVRESLTRNTIQEEADPDEANIRRGGAEEESNEHGPSEPEKDDNSKNTLGVKIVGPFDIGIPYSLVELGPRRNLKRGAEDNELHLSAYRKETRALVERLVAYEGPIHMEYLISRIASAAGFERVGSRIREAILFEVSNCVKNKELIRVGDFLWPQHLNYPIKPRFPIPNDPKTRRNIEYIAPEEISAAMLKLVELSFSITSDSLQVEAAQMFGFERMVDDVRNVMESSVRSLLKQGKITWRDGRLTIAKQP